MPSSSIVGGVTRFVQVTPATPIATITASAATWRGNSHRPDRVFPLLAGQSFSAPGSGRWGLASPGVSVARGTIDAWLDMGTVPSAVLILHAGPNPATAPFHTFGVNAAGQSTGVIRDHLGTAMATWASTTHAAVIAGRPVHIQVAWDALASIDGGRHLKVMVNDVVVPFASYSVNPITPWTPFVPAYLSTGTYADAAFDGQMMLTQLASRVSI